MKILDGTFLHSKCSSLRTSCFIPHQKAPSLKTSPIHQLTFEVNQFCILWHVDLSQWFHGTKMFFFERVPNDSHGVSNSILMRHNSNGWFMVGRIDSGLVFLVTSSNSFCSPLWKVTTSYRLILGCSSRSGLLMWLTSTLSYKTYSTIFFIFLISTIGIL